ncbi:15284_t:CDS:1, partial [Racocetra fulgida]
MNEIDKVTYFIKGFKPATRTEVVYQAPATLEEAWVLAIWFDTAMFGIGRPSTNKPQQHYIQRTGKRGGGGPTSMELDYAGSSSNNYSKKEKKENCFKCEQVEHYTKNCKGKCKQKLINIEDKPHQLTQAVTNN